MTEKRGYFWKYFNIGIISFLMLFVPNSCNSYFDPGVRTFEEMLIFGIYIFLPIGFCISFIYYYYEQVYAPKKVLKMLDHPSLEDFKTLGFKISKKYFLEGVYKGLKIQIQWLPYSPMNDSRNAIAFFYECTPEPSSLNQLNKDYRKEKVQFYEDGILSVEEILFKTPKKEVLKKRLDDLIEIARLKGLTK